MKKIIILTLCAFWLGTLSMYAQCLACSAQTNASSSTIFTPTTSGATRNLRIGSGYLRLNVVQGRIYLISLCSTSLSAGVDPNMQLYDTQRNLLAYNCDYCGSKPYIEWQATFSGEVRLQVMNYISNSSRCNTHSSSVQVSYSIVSAPAASFTPNGAGLTLNWSDVAGEAGYWVLDQNGTIISPPIDPDVTSYDFPNPGVYKATVQAVYNTTVMNSNAVLGISVPQNVRATSLSTSTIRIRGNSVPGATRYRYEDCNDASIFASGTSTSGNLSPYSPNTLVEGKMFAEYNGPLGSVRSEPSPCVSATTDDVPPPPIDGELSITIEPSEAVSAGATYQLNGTTFGNGVTHTLAAGSYVVSPNPMSGWIAPTSVNTVVTAGQTSSVVLTYTRETAPVTVYIQPAAAASWNVDGTGTYAPGSTQSVTTGVPHQISGSAIPGFQTPASVPFTLTSTAPFIVTLTYTPNIVATVSCAPLNYATGILRTPTLLYTGQLGLSVPPIKICADGGNATMVNLAPELASLVGLPLGISVVDGLPVAEAGSFALVSNGTYRYTHPSYIANGQNVKLLSVAIYNTQTNETLATIPFEIHRAPAVFVHGLYGSSRDFNPLIQELKSTKFLGLDSILLAKVNFESTNDAFVVNRQVVSRGIEALLVQARANGFSASKVDIVAHSTGGLLTRMYHQGIAGVGFRNDLHKEIFIAAPHSGMEMADYISNPAQARLCSDISSAMTNGRTPGCSRAFSEVDVNNPIIRSNLNGTSLSRLTTSAVPTYSIVTQGGASQTNVCSFVYTLLTVARAPWATIFNGQQHDGMVGVTSQTGGVSKSQTFSGVCHFGALQDAGVRAKVSELLDLEPSAANFDVDGYRPPVLNSPYFGAPRVQKSLLDIDITSPTYGTIAPWSSNLDIDIVSATADTVMTFAFPLSAWGSSQTSIGSGRTSVTVPFDVVGPQLIMAIAVDSTGNYVSDTVTVFVESTEPLVGILAPETIYLRAGDTTQVELTGLFADGQELPIERLSGLGYTSQDPGIAIGAAQAQVVGMRAGTTTVTFSMSGIAKNVQVIVFDGARVSPVPAAIFQQTGQVLTCTTPSVVLAWESGLPDVSYNWSTGETSSSITVFTPGNYSFTLTDVIENISRVDSVNITQDNTPPSITVYVQNDTIFADANAVSFEWSLGNIVVGNAANYRPNQTGRYQVIATGANGCTSTAEVEFVVSGLQPLASEGYSLRVFPNPVGASESVMVVFENTSDLEYANFSILDIQGRVLQAFSKPVMTGENRLSLDLMLSPGTYQVKVHGIGNAKLVVLR